MNDLHIVMARWPADAERLMRIRRQVFIEEQGVPEHLEWDGADAEAAHFIAEDAKGQVVATARLLANGHVGRMAVLPQWRRRGVASALLRAVMRLAKTRGMQSLKLNAQSQVVGLYEKHGFRVQGGEFLEAGIPHRTMTRSLDGWEED
jgi:predicted GNAT family N-acyltransferase